MSNRTTSEEDVSLLTGTATVAEFPTLGPGTTRPLLVTLEPGNYEWVCTSLTGTIAYSPRREVKGPRVADPSPAYRPIIADQLTPSVTAYRSFVTAGLQRLATATDALVHSSASGDRATSQAAWLQAHLVYAGLGAAYGTFGNYADTIDGRADGLVGKALSPHFTGFLAVEYALWHHLPMRTVHAEATYLYGQVKQLVQAWPHQLFAVTNLPLRAHEILENTLQFELTGDTNEGSGTNLATSWANVQGTREVISTLTSLLEPRDPHLPEINRDLTGLSRELAGFRHGQRWTPLAALSMEQREKLDADFDGLLALTDQIPVDLEAQIGAQG